MDVKQPFSITRYLTTAAAIAVTLNVSGCASVVSQRYNHEPDCAAELSDEGHIHRGIPVAIWPNVSLPRCFSRAGRAEISQDFNEFLQPEPPAPLKPPHSRFHPLPTQPVFAQRAEYREPELLGVAPSTVPGELIDSPSAEEIPVPVAEQPAEPGWRLLPTPEQAAPVPEGTAPPQARPIEMQPPLTQPPAGDASRGSVAPASFTSASEPNPLRPSSGATSSRTLR